MALKERILFQLVQAAVQVDSSLEPQGPVLQYVCDGTGCSTTMYQDPVEEHSTRPRSVN